MNTKRIALGAATLLAAGIAITGCTTTSYTCNNDECTVTLNGSGASTDVGSSGYTVELEGADGDTANFSIDGNTATCSEGDTVDVGGYSATCTTVGDDELVVEIA